MIDKYKFQLIGVTCMKIADVYNEKSKEYYRQENANEYAYITADEYSPQDVINSEKMIINSLAFNLSSPTIIHFIKLYNLIIQMNPITYVLALVYYTHYIYIYIYSS